MLQFPSLGHCYVIAEISANHNGSLDAALELVRLAKECGADAVKLQTYTADTITLDCDNDYFRVGGGTLWDGETLHRLYSRACTPWEWHGAIFAEAERVGIGCFSTPFDESAVDFLEQFSPPCYKIASFELTHHPLLRRVGKTGRPVIMSTGMASFEEIGEAVAVLRGAGCGELALLKCTSSYPAPAEEANLARIPHMAARFSCVAGLSDHTMDVAVPVAAVALGARIVEKHFCRSRSEPGPDSAFSLEPGEFKAMAEAVRVAALAVGSVTYEVTEREKKSLAFRRSIFFARNLKAGEVVDETAVKVVRPSHGLAPRYWEAVVGKRVVRDVAFGTPVTWEALA